MTLIPLDAFSEVTDERRRWTPEWYTWLSKIEDSVNAAIEVATVSGGFTTGDTKLTFKSSPDDGWIIANDGSIGSVASNATTRHHADTAPLFTLLYNNITSLIVQNSSGTVVARGASAAADYGNNRRLVIPAMRGRVLGVPGTGTGLTARTLGVAVGAETETPTTAKTAAHSHNPPSIYGGTFLGMAGAFNNFTFGGPGSVYAADTPSTGGGSPLNIMQPTNFIQLMIKL